MKGYVYLLAEWGDQLRYKIGITKNNVEKRVKQLSTGNSNEIKIIRTYESEYYKKIEQSLHKKYNTKRNNGEWFTLTDKEVGLFSENCETLHENFKFLSENNPFF